MGGRLKLRIEVIQELILQVKRRGAKLTIEMYKMIKGIKEQMFYFLLLNALFYDNMNVQEYGNILI